MTDKQNSPTNDHSDDTSRKSSVTVKRVVRKRNATATFTKGKTADAVKPLTPAQQLNQDRLGIYAEQQRFLWAYLQRRNRTSLPIPLDLLDSSAQTALPEFLTQDNVFASPFIIESIRDELIETQKFQIAEQTNLRGLAEMDALYNGFDHLYLVDDMLDDIFDALPKQALVGWEVSSRSQNHLGLPTVGNNPKRIVTQANFASLPCYVLAHMGVASYTNDRGYYLGHVAGYLFVCYFFSYLKIQYGVTPMVADIVKDLDYDTVTIAEQVQLLQQIDYDIKKTIYRLAVFCGKLSQYRINKVIEKMLIKEVNDFDKIKEQRAVEHMIRHGG